MKPTQEQVIAWAREAGATRDHPEHLPDLWTMDTKGFIQFVTLAYEAGRKDENEACEEAIADEMAMWKGLQDITDFKLCAARVRARREQ